VTGKWALNVPETRSGYLGVSILSWVSMGYFQLDLVLLCDGPCGPALSVDWCWANGPGRLSSLGLRIISGLSWAFRPIYYLVGIFPNSYPQIPLIRDSLRLREFYVINEFYVMNFFFFLFSFVDQSTEL
jgi:hypothetical protein